MLIYIPITIEMDFTKLFDTGFPKLFWEFPNKPKYTLLYILKFYIKERFFKTEKSS